MKQEEIEQKIREMKTCEFMTEIQVKKIEVLSDNFIRHLNDFFGYNDGEPLDEDGIKFVIEYLTNKWKLANAVYEDDEPTKPKVSQ